MKLLRAKRKRERGPDAPLRFIHAIEAPHAGQTSLVALRALLLPQIRRQSLEDERLDRLVRAHRDLGVRTEAAHRHSIFARFLAADG